VPVSVADLAKYYADSAPPKNDSLADLEARLEALSSPSYRSPFKFDPSSLSSLADGAFGTTKYGRIGSYISVADVLKPPTVPDVASLYPLHRAAGLGTPEAPTISELFAQRYGASSSPLWKELAKSRGTSPGLFGKFLHEGGNALGRALERLRPQLKTFGMFAGVLAARVENVLSTLRTTWPRDPYGNRVPGHNASLYVLARWAYRGDYEARAEFLDEIGADSSADNVYYLDRLLRPTFDPTPQDLGGRRCNWERYSPEDARRHLLERLRDLNAEDGQAKDGLKRGLILPWKNEQGEERVSEEDFALFALDENERYEARQAELRAAFGALPERRLQVARFKAEGLTAEETAARLGISSSSVRTHMQLLRQDPTLQRLHRP
jgi:hypothetical protein